MKTLAAWIVLVSAASLAAAGCGSSVEGGAKPDPSANTGNSALEAYQDAIDNASITLPEAIDIVAAAYPDGVVYSGELALDSEAEDGEEDDNEAGASVGATYEIEVFDGTQILEVDVHPGTGAIESAEPEDDDEADDEDDDDHEDGDDEDDDEEDDDGENNDGEHNDGEHNDGEQDGLCDGSISLNAAIAAAEAETGGTAVEVESNADDCEIDVKVVTADSLLEVTVGKDGSIVEVEEADDEHEDGDDEDEDGEDGNEDEDGEDEG